MKTDKKEIHILFIFDNKFSLASFCEKAAQFNLSGVILCPLTTDQAVIQSISKRMEELCPVEVVDFPALFHQTGYALREDFINFISYFSEAKVKGKSIKRYFKYPFKDFSVWWLSLIAEKNTLKTEAFHNLAKLCSILNIVKNHESSEIWVDVDNRLLVESLRANTIASSKITYLKNNFKHQELFVILATIKNLMEYLLVLFKKIFIVKLNMKNKRERIVNLLDNRYLAVTYFSSIDKKGLASDKFINRYYGPLQNALRDNAQGSYSWLAIVVNEDDLDFKKSISLAEKFNKKGENLFVFEEWVGIFDLARIALEYFYISFKFILAYSHIRKKFVFQDKITIWPLFSPDWFSSFMGKTLFESLFYYRAFINIFRVLKQETKVLYISEMHAWEKALVCAGSNCMNIKLVALQHATVPLLLLHYFNTRSELSRDSLIDGVPKPDFLGCVGRVTNRLFVECGWPENRLFFPGALRYQHLKSAIVNHYEKKDMILVALSILSGESRELLIYIHQAFKGENGYKIVIKNHPDSPLEQLLKDSGIEFDKGLFMFTNDPLSELMKESKIMITNSSSAAVEAIAHRIPVFSLLLSSYLNMNPLLGLFPLVKLVKSPDELRAMAKSCLNDFQLLDYTACSSFINDYFTFLEKDSEFLERIKILN